MGSGAKRDVARFTLQATMTERVEITVDGETHWADISTAMYDDAVQWAINNSATVDEGLKHYLGGDEVEVISDTDEDAN